MVRVGEMAEYGKFRVEKFNSQNYQLWKMQMEDYLYPLLGGKAKQSIAMKDEEWEVLDRKELGTIRMCLDFSLDFNSKKKRQ